MEAARRMMYVTITTNHTTLPQAVVGVEEQMREIVRKEIASLPIPFIVSSMAPEDANLGGEGQDGNSR
jgi:hypothetical protein